MKKRQSKRKEDGGGGVGENNRKGREWRKSERGVEERIKKVS